MGIVLANYLFFLEPLLQDNVINIVSREEEFLVLCLKKMLSHKS